MLLLADRGAALAPPVACSLLAPGLSCAKAASVAFAAAQVDIRNRESAMVADGNARMPICDLPDSLLIVDRGRTVGMRGRLQPSRDLRPAPDR